MSTLIVEVTEVLDVQKHPNADKLDLVTVKGWQVVSNRKRVGDELVPRYKIGDVVIYCPIDAVLPVKLSDALEITSYLSKGRVKTVRFRGEYSQGLIIGLEHLLPEQDKITIGMDVKDFLGITKYEPPVSLNMGGECMPHDERFQKNTNTENIKNFPDVLKEGEEVVITEKLHGSSFRCAKTSDGARFYVGSKNMNLKESKHNMYWRAARKYKLEEILQPGQTLYGEVYGRTGPGGKGIQKLQYGQNDVTLGVFDLRQNGVFVDFDKLLEFCKNNQLPLVPLLYSGPWSTDLMSLADGQSTIAKHIREGFVVKPTTERHDIKLGRVQLKHISEKYLLKDYGDLG